MHIEVVSICYNESAMMPYFLRHYGSFADSITIMDGGSSDGTREIVGACPIAKLTDMPFHGCDDQVFAGIYSRYVEPIFSEEPAWVLCVDCDEFIWHVDGLRVALERELARGSLVIKAEGYEMVSPVFPTTSGQIYDEIKTGFRNEWTERLTSKMCIVRRGLSFRWGVGRHRIERMDPSIVPVIDSGIKLLHYRKLGKEYSNERSARNWSTHSDRNRKMGWGIHCSPFSRDTEQSFLELEKQAVIVT